MNREKALNVTKNPVSFDNFAHKDFIFNTIFPKSERKTNLHRGWVGVPLWGPGPGIASIGKTTLEMYRLFSTRSSISIMRRDAVIFCKREMNGSAPGKVELPKESFLRS
jgi:hypothetical protein